MEFLFSKKILIYKGLFNFYLLATLLIVSIFILAVDVPKLKKDGFQREANISKVISIIYIILAPTIYIIFKLI